MKVYLCGPMSGVPEFNVPAFHDATEKLRARGYEVVTPVEMDIEEGRRPEDAEWSECLARDLDYILTSQLDGLVVLPGWEFSRGAKLETFVARLCGIPVLHYGPRDPLRQVQRALLQYTHSLKGAA